MSNYRIVIPKANGNYSAHSPDLAGCVATGKTWMEVRNMRAAIDLHIQGLQEDELSVPRPGSSAETMVVDARPSRLEE